MKNDSYEQCLATRVQSQHAGFSARARIARVQNSIFQKNYTRTRSTRRGRTLVLSQNGKMFNIQFSLEPTIFDDLFNFLLLFDTYLNIFINYTVLSMINIFCESVINFVWNESAFY